MPRDLKNGNNNMARRISSDLIPDTESAVQHYQTVQGRLTLQSVFGADQIDGDNVKIAARQETFFQYFDIKSIFENALIGGDSLERAIIYFNELTRFFAES